MAMQTLDDPARVAAPLLAALANAVSKGDGLSIERALVDLQRGVVTVGARGLAASAEWLRANVARDHKRGLPARIDLCAAWLATVVEYLEAPPAGRAGAAASLIAVSRWEGLTIQPTATGVEQLRTELADWGDAAHTLRGPAECAFELADRGLPDVTEWPAHLDVAPLPALPVDAREDLDLAVQASATLTDKNDGLRRAAASAYAAALARVIARLHETDLAPLGDVCAAVLPTLAKAADEGVAMTDPWLLLAMDLPTFLQAALFDPSDEAKEALLACLSDPAWTLAPSNQDVAEMRSQFGLPPELPQAREFVQSLFGELPAGLDGLPVTGPGTLPDDEAAPIAAANEAGGASSHKPCATDLPADTGVASAASFEPAATCDVDPAHVAVLEAEFTNQAPEMVADIDAACHSSDALEDSAAHLQRLGVAADAVGLHALAWLAQRLGHRVLRATPALNEVQHRWLRDLPARLRAYLAAPTDPSAAGALVEAVQEGGDFAGCDADTLALLQLSLTNLRLVAGPGGPRRASEATDEDVSLAVPQDVSTELLDGLLAELPVQSAEFSAAMQRIAGGAGSMLDLDHAKRAAHTLKGAANTVGVRGIAELTHTVEDILSALAQHGRLPQGRLAASLVEAADCLEAMSEALAGTASPPQDARRVLQQALEWANRIDEQGVDAAAPPESARASTAPSPSLSVESDLSARPSAVPESPAPAESAATAEATLRVKATLIDELLRLVGETMIANTQIREQLRQTQEQQRAAARQSAVLSQLAGELEHLVDVRGIDSAAPGARPSDLDALEFDHYNELHTLSRRLVEASADSRELASSADHRLGALAELIEHQGRIALDNRSVVMNTRMVPVAGIVPRLQRSVRQTARLLDKRVDLHVKGESSAIDGSVLSALVDPLMHLLRNACDHGIEPEARRLALGKPAIGRIDLGFAREGDSIVVRCSDDGAGLDLARVRAKAEQRSLLPRGQAISDDDLARLILLPGFSTRDEATQTSGRGVGMDAVYAMVLGLKGQLRLKNDPGRGLTVELRLPTSMMTSHGVLVRLGEQVVALSSQGVQDVVFVQSGEVRALGARQVLHLGGKVLDFDRLDLLLAQDHRDKDRDWFPALMVQTEAGALRAVRVQDVLSSQEIVVKSLGRYVPRPQGVIGVTILGDGTIAPVIDLPSLLRSPLEAASRSRGGRGALRSHIDARRDVLVVDDSLSARRAAAQLMRDAGYEVRTAIDGLEAAALVDKRVPDIVLVDMEMPRMNGLELTSHLRNREATRHLPVIMITSRSAEKHRKMAEAAGVDVYLTKPFNDEELLTHVERLLERVHA